MLKNESLIVEFQHLGQVNRKKLLFGISRFPPHSLESHHIGCYLAPPPLKLATVITFEGKII